MTEPTGEQSANLFLNRKGGGTELYLIRHGDAIPGPETALPGSQYDDQPLSSLGRLQAEAVGQEWGKLKFDAIYSSPLRRTLETAAPLAQIQKLKVDIEQDLIEVRLGTEAPQLRILSDSNPSKTSQALRARLDWIVATVARTGYWSSIPGAEPSESFRRRVVTAVDGIAEKHKGQRVAIFSHGGVINVYLAELLGLEKDFFFPIPNTSVSVVRVSGSRRLLMAINDTGHLRNAHLASDE